MKSRLATSIRSSFLNMNLRAKNVLARDDAVADRAYIKRVWRWTRTQSRGCWLLIYTSKLPTEN